jgi:hypothetical protein
MLYDVLYVKIRKQEQRVKYIIGKSWMNENTEYIEVKTLHGLRKEEEHSSVSFKIQLALV